MSQFPDYSRRVELEYGTTDRVMFNFFNQVYAWMFAGLAVTGTVAYLVSQNTTMLKYLYTSGLYLPLFLAQILFVIGIQKAALRVNATLATTLFLIYAAFLGMMISFIFIVYPIATLAGAFVVTAGVFGAMSLYGFVTKRDLTAIGSFLIMGVIGIFLASIVNYFIASSALDWAITYLGVFIFVGLTAYDTQKLKNIAQSLEGNPQMAARMSIIGSLMLYLDFINLFLFLLRIMGRRR
jgi:FtsH-binding integral membrane protein